MKAGKRKKTPVRSPAKTGVTNIPAKYDQKTKITSRKIKKATIRKIKNTATRKTNKSATKRATSMRAGTDGKEDEVVPAKKCKTSNRGKRRNCSPNSGYLGNNSTSYDDMANMENKVVDKKSNDVKLGLLELKLKKKEKNKARRMKKQKQNWSNMGANKKVQQININENIDPSMKPNTSQLDEGTATDTSIYSPNNKKFKKVMKDTKKEKNTFKKKNDAEKLKKKEKNKARWKNKFQLNQSSIGPNEKVHNDDSKEEMVSFKKQKTFMPNQGKATHTKITDTNNDGEKVQKEANINGKKICGKQGNEMNLNLEEIKLKKKGKNKAKREKKRDQNKSRIEALKKLYTDKAAKKLKTSMPIKGMHEEVVSAKDTNSTTSMKDKSRAASSTDTTCIINTKDDLKEVKKNPKKNKEVGGKNVHLEKLMLRKRENKKARRKIQQQKKAASKFIGMKSSHFEEAEAPTKKKFNYPNVTKNKRSERAIEKSKKRYRG